jgi:hypothetical protein
MNIVDASTVRRLAALALVVAPLAGCEALAISALGAGASAGVSYSINGAAYRTFTAPEEKVRTAALAGLKRMGGTVESTELTDSGRLIKASMAERKIEVAIEPLSDTATRVRAVAKHGWFTHDTATATEIIAQTEKALAPVKDPRAATRVRAGL